MFDEARIKLTAYYLAIIMAITLSFSAVIFTGINSELKRIEAFQRSRIQRIFLGFHASFQIDTPDIDAINEARHRILIILGLVNIIILTISGAGGYVLAGKTLDPIKRAMEEQKEFVGSASHELRTPLTSIKTETEVALRDKKLTLKDAKQLLKSNLEDVNRMQKLSNYLLTLNKFQSEAERLPMQKIKVDQIVASMVGRLMPLAKVKNISIQTDLQELVIKGNQDAIEELITILLDNAIKYSNQNSEVEVSVSESGYLRVKDYGVGIAKEDMPHIFERFYRSDKSRKRDGYGLGLSIAKSIVDLHGATIKTNSKPGQGSIFKVSFS